MKCFLIVSIKWRHHNIWSYNLTHGGAYGDLINENVEQIVSPFILRLERVHDVTSTSIFASFKSVFMFLTPKHEEIFNDSIFLQPFDKKVWIYTMFSIILISILLKVIFYYEIPINHNNDFYPSWLTVLIGSLGAICQQGYNLKSKLYSGKFIIIILLFFTFILYNFYTSNVVSTLISSPIKTKIKTLRQLADSNLKIGIEKIGYTTAFLYVSIQQGKERVILKYTT